jgi:hypothetical protein
VCYAHLYNFRTVRIGLACLLASYVLPSVGLAVSLNIPRVLEISSLGQVLEQNQSYLRFFMFYQVFSSVIYNKIKPFLLKTDVQNLVVCCCCNG